MHNEKQLIPYLERNSMSDAIPHILRYYQNKYPERPSIHYVSFDTHDKTELLTKLNILSTQNPDLPIKVLITHIRQNEQPLRSSYTRNNVHITMEYKKGDFIHMEPSILLNKRLTILRNSWLMEGSIHPEWQDTSHYLRENGYEIILPKNILNTNVKTNGINNYLSYQGSSAYGCFPIGISILKDITSADLEKYSKLEQNYSIPPKVLKYSPSRTFITGNIGEYDFKNTIIKAKEAPANNETLALYFAKHTKIQTRLSISQEGDESERRTVRTRIEEKTSKYLDILQNAPISYKGRRTMSRTSFSIS